MTRKHFEALANELSSVRPSEEELHRFSAWTDCMISVAKVCRYHSRNFDWERFTDACKTRKSYAYVAYVK